LNEQDSAVATPPAPQAASAESPASPLQKKKEKKKLDPPYLSEVKDYVRQFCIAEKHHRLYPLHSKVVQHALNGYIDSCTAYLQAARDSLQLRVSQTSLLFDDVEVYREETISRSLAHQLYKDGVRGVVILEEVTPEELSSFLSCFRETARAEEDEADFGTVFWEKDCTSIQLQLIDEAEEAGEEMPVDIPTSHLFALGFDSRKFDLPAEEETQLRKQLSDRLANNKGDDTFMLADDEVESIRKLAASEEEYFAIFDFVDILIEHLAGGSDEDGFEDATRMIHDIAFALIENVDFEHAANLVGKIILHPHPALTETQRKHVRAIADSLCDKQTMELVSDFLRDSAKLSKNHPVFKFLNLLGKDALPVVCEFLEFTQHIGQLSRVLIQLGKASGKTFGKHMSKRMMSAASSAACAMIHVILETAGQETGLVHVAKALKHGDSEVRKFAAKTILEHGDEKVGSYFMPLLDDPPLLSIALQFYAKVSYPQAFEALASMITRDGFHTLEASRQILCFRALTLADPEKSLEFVSTDVLKWRYSLNQKTRRRKVAALRSLTDHPNEGAVPVLERFAALKKSPLAGVAAQSLRMREKGSSGGLRRNPAPRSKRQSSVTPAPKKEKEAQNV